MVKNRVWPLGKLRESSGAPRDRQMRVRIPSIWKPGSVTAVIYVTAEATSFPAVRRSSCSLIFFAEQQPVERDEGPNDNAESPDSGLFPASASLSAVFPSPLGRSPVTLDTGAKAKITF